ncbi:Bud-site selection protein [Trametes polyzona]|nr:Bud-site selection protein [Trametes polyzona]
MAPSSPHPESSTQRGTKRKRSAGTKARAPPVKRDTPGELIGKKLHHGLQEVRKAAKKAVAFELRKLVKRLKAARGEKPAKGNVKVDDAAELERQLEVLKHIDHEPFANTALKTRILKERLLADNEDVKAAVSEKLSENLVQPQTPGSSAAKVHGRILSSKTIADVVHTVVDSLKEIVDPSLAKAKAKQPKLEDEESGDEEDEDEGVDAPPTKNKKARVAASEDNDEGASSGIEDDQDAAGWESGTVDGGDEDDAGWESGSIDGGEPGIARSSDVDDDDDEEKGEEDDSENERDEDDEAPAAAAAKPKAKAAPAKDPKGKAKALPGESTFLPSLSVGFTRGDSDASDLSDADAEAAAADLPKKNRRGQRARRAIWEKKYGKNANHVKKQQQQQPQRGSARPHDPRQRNGKGAGGGDKGTNRAAPGRGGRGVPYGQQQQQRGPGAPPVDSGWPKRQGGGGAGGPTAGSAGGRKEKGDDKPLHPSWEAKKKLKEKLNPSIVPAQGKKIKFS